MNTNMIDKVTALNKIRYVSLTDQTFKETTIFTGSFVSLDYAIYNKEL